MLCGCIIINSCVWRQYFAISMVDVKIYFVHTIFIKSNSVRHIKPFLYTDFGYRLLCLPDLEYWFTPGVTWQPGIRIPPRSILSHPWYIQGSMFVMHTYLYWVLFRIAKLITICYFCLFSVKRIMVMLMHVLLSYTRYMHITLF